MSAPSVIAVPSYPEADELTSDERATRTNELFLLLGRASPAVQPSIRAEIISLHLRVVRGMAARYCSRGEEFDELFQVGCVGLVKTVNGFDAGRGEFAAYAKATISGEIKRHFRDRCWGIRPVRRIQELNARLNGARADLEQELGRSPTEDELAEALGESVADVQEALATHHMYRLTSMDAPVADGTLSMSDVCATEEAGFGSVETYATLRDAMSDLADLDREVIRMRFVADLTQREIAERIGTTQMQVSRILSRAYARLRKRIGPLDGLEPPEPQAS